MADQEEGQEKRKELSYALRFLATSLDPPDPSLPFAQTSPEDS